MGFVWLDGGTCAAACASVAAEDADASFASGRDVFPDGGGVRGFLGARCALCGLAVALGVTTAESASSKTNVTDSPKDIFCAVYLKWLDSITSPAGPVPLKVSKKNMRIGSLDVGVTNLALCILDTERGSIDEWRLFSLPKQVEQIPRALLALFSSDLSLETLDAVLIEKQPGKNKTMVRVEAYLYMLFTSLKCNVKLYSARNKLANSDVCFRGRSRDSYKLRKRASIMLTRKYLNDTKTVNPTRLAEFEASTKKDDLADSLLQALSYGGCVQFNAIGADQTPDTRVSRTDVLVNARPRAPTAGQSKKGQYSMSNILHFWKTSRLDPCEFEVLLTSTKGLADSINRYFGSFAACVSSLKVE